MRILFMYIPELSLQNSIVCLKPGFSFLLPIDILIQVQRCILDVKETIVFGKFRNFSCTRPCMSSSFFVRVFSRSICNSNTGMDLKPQNTLIWVNKLYKIVWLTKSLSSCAYDLILSIAWRQCGTLHTRCTLWSTAVFRIISWQSNREGSFIHQLSSFVGLSPGNLLNLKYSTPSYIVYGELGTYPIDIDIKVRTMSYCARLNVISFQQFNVHKTNNVT